MRLNKKAFPPECRRGTGECKAPMPILVTSYQVRRWCWRAMHRARASSPFA